MATGRDMRARLRLEFREGASAGLDRVIGRLSRLQAAARRVSAAAAIIAAVSFAGPVRQAGAYEGGLRDIAITAGATGQAVEAEMGRMNAAFQRLAVQYRVSLTDIRGAQDILTARGLTSDESTWLMPMLAEFHAASGTAMEDLAQLSVALMRIARVEGPEGMREAMRELFRAGQLGGFELRNMARYLPSIFAQFEGLGMRQMNAVRAAGSGMQIVRDAAGTAEESAAAFQQLVGHIMSESTIKHLGELGVNMQRVYRNAVAAMQRGENVNPFEAFIEHARRLTARDQARIFQIMPDQNSRQALQAMITGARRYLDIKREMAATRDDMVSRTTADRMRGLNAELRLFDLRMSQLGLRLGDAVGSALAPINEALGMLVEHIDALNERYPGLVDQTVAWGAGLAGLVLSLGAVGRAVGFLASGLRFLLYPVVALIGGIVGLIGLKLAIIIGVIVALAAAAYLLWRYWDQVGPWFRAMWEAIQGYFFEFVDWLMGWASSAYAGAIAVIQGVWEVLSTWFGTLWDYWVREPFERFVAWVDSWTGGAMSAVIERIQAAWRGVGDFFRALWDGIRSGFEAIWGPILSAIERVERFFNRGSSEGGAGYTAADQAARTGNFGRRGAAMAGFYPPDAAMAGMSRAPWAGEIVVRAEPGTEVLQASTPDRNVRISTPDRGMSRGRP